MEPITYHHYVGGGGCGSTTATLTLQPDQQFTLAYHCHWMGPPERKMELVGTYTQTGNYYLLQCNGGRDLLDEAWTFPDASFYLELITLTAVVQGPEDDIRYMTLSGVATDEFDALLFNEQGIGAQCALGANIALSKTLEGLKLCRLRRE
jgi:hypothetical protein